MRYFVKTFGCQMNISDSERICSFLEKFGFKKAEKLELADLAVINMCSVRQKAVDRVFGLKPKFEKIKEKNPKFKSILTGCILKKDLLKFKNFFDFILAKEALSKWENFLKKERGIFYPNLRKEKIKISCFKFLPKRFEKFKAFIPISWGCDNFCSFCVVPFTRGKLICRSHLEILKEAEEAIKEKVKEIWLLGQNVNDYSSPKDKKVKFSQLLEKISQIKGNFWIRFTSPHPKNFSKELISKIAQLKKITPYLNIPLQSGDDQILKKMNRNYTVFEYENLIGKIRSAFEKYREGLAKDPSLSTDIIVGFPQEKEKNFENTLNFLKKIEFDSAYIALYSPRVGTLAFKMKDHLSYKEKKKRWKIISDLVSKIAKKRNKRFLGKTIDVLVEKKIGSFYFGKSAHFKTVKIKERKDLKIGSFAKVKIIGANAFGLVGK